MPAISLVVCVYKQRDLLKRLLDSAEGCYDDLVVIHDGPDESGVRQLIERYRGRFLDQPRQYTHEPHWPFAWEKCFHDWILLFDADEILSVDLAGWLKKFRTSFPPESGIAGFTCIWPLWDGKRQVTYKWPDRRLFLINRLKVRYFGMGENRPLPIGNFQPLPLTLHHQPERKSYGLRNILFRRSAWRWRQIIATSLLGKPTDLPCWRWTSQEWPQVWEQIRRRPIRTATKRLLGWPFRTAREMKGLEGRVIFSAIISGGIHHCLIALAYWRLRAFGPGR